MAGQQGCTFSYLSVSPYEYAESRPFPRQVLIAARAVSEVQIRCPVTMVSWFFRSRRNPKQTHLRTRLTRPLIATIVLWIHSRIFPKSQKSSSESSSLEKQTQARLPSCKDFATPPRVRRSITLIHRAIVSWYVLRVLPSGALDLIVY